MLHFGSLLKEIINFRLATEMHWNKIGSRTLVTEAINKI